MSSLASGDMLSSVDDRVSPAFLSQFLSHFLDDLSLPVPPQNWLTAVTTTQVVCGEGDQTMFPRASTIVKTAACSAARKRRGSGGMALLVVFVLLLGGCGGQKAPGTEAVIQPTAIQGTIRSDQHQDEQIGEQLDTYLRNLVDADRFSGVVLVAKDGATLFESAYGTANRADATPNTMATRFDLASASKMFTAVAIAQLVEQGRLAYDDPISVYLPDYPVDVARRVTVDHLLTHRSGIVDFFADVERFATVKHSLDPQRDYLALFMHEPLRFSPGERFDYSNSNYILLGAIIERVSGQRYDDYIRRHIFEPAGMAETSLSRRDIASALLAQGYTHMGEDGVMTKGERRLASAELPAVGSAAGGAFSTAGDLLRFDRALRTHRLLSQEATEQLLADRVDYGRPGYRYSYGFIVRTGSDERIIGHSGGFPGVDTQFDMYLDSGYTVIVLSNYEFVAEPVVMRLQRMLPRT
jgi:CubicO group peptidase (beta-lactamase class C family)